MSKPPGSHANTQDQVRIRRWSALNYHDPVPLLLELRNLEYEIAGARIEEKVRALRTNKLKKHRELREAAVFCHGMGSILGRTIRFARWEEDGYDFIMLQKDEDRFLFTPLQIKELVPSSLNPSTSLDSILTGLGRYANASDTVVAIHINQRIRMNLKDIVVPDVKVGQIWLFGGADEMAEGFALYGDLCNDPRLYRFDLPS